MAKIFLKEDFKAFFQWWFVLLLLGITFLPLAQKIFFHFHDNGYLFAKTIGIALSGYLMWLLSSMKLLKFNTVSCILVILIGILFNAILLVRMKTEHKKTMFTAQKLTSMISEELLFLIIFLIWTYIRGFKPEAYGTEKFMDYGFMTIMMRGDYMPPKDLWFAGSTINYYYVGQYMAAFMTKLSVVKVNAGYNLMLMTLASFGFVLPYSLVYNVTKNFFIEQDIRHRKSPVFAGLLSGAGVSLAGNMHFTLFYWFVPIIKTILGVKSEDKYWFPNSTRFIGYNPDTKDKTIHEFPSYSFVLGDLHAHAINIIFVLTVLGILFGWLLYRKKSMDNLRQKESAGISGLLRNIMNPHILLIGFFIGLFHTTNFWDFPIYYVVSGAVILFFNLVAYRDYKIRAEVDRYRLLKNPYVVTAIQGITVLIISEVTALPFTLTFDQISTQINLAMNHTPVYQLIILWGLPVTLIVGLVVDLISNYKQKINKPEEEKKGSIVYYKGGRPGSFIDFLGSLNISELFIVILGLCGIGLILIPEIIYIKDIYSGDFKRANTMFKLTYQAFILFGVSSGFIFLKFIKARRFKWQLKFAIITLILFLSSFWYTKVSVGAWYGNVFNPEKYKGLDAAAYLQEKMPDDYLGIQWLNQNIKGTPVILEANGDSYSDYERVSVATGLPTVLGWYVHEWLWRGSTEVINKRAEDIKTIYTSTDADQVRSLLDEYKIEYIYVGKLERDKYSDLNDQLLKSLGEVVFISPTTREKTYETYIIKVNPND
jgi:YYY domain-containing protein